MTENGQTPGDGLGAVPPHPQANGHGDAHVPEPEPEPEPEAGPARALTLHLLHMLETRMDAAGIAIDIEVQSFKSRIQLNLAAAAGFFFAIWGGIVLLAIALPEPYRIPVLAAVVGAFALGGLWALFAAKRKVASTDVGSMRWFRDSLKADLEVLSRTLNRKTPAPHPQAQQRSANDDLAA